MGKDNEYIIPVIPGDGVGPTLVDYAKKSLNAIGKKTGSRFSFIECSAGYEAYKAKGVSVPDETIDILRKFPVALLGAMSSKDCPAPSPMGQLRKALGLFADIRHCISSGNNNKANIDVVVVRECSEGFLADRNMFLGSGEFMPTSDTVLSMRLITKEKCDKIAEIAYEYGRKNGRRKITLGHKEVVFTLGCGLFKRSALERAKSYLSIKTDEENVDGLAGNLVSHPERYDIILTTNLFGDILSDILAAQVGGSIPIINTNMENALFYPSHGAMKNCVQEDNINPVTMFRTVSSMLYWLELKEEGEILDAALKTCGADILNNSGELSEGITSKKLADRVLDAINNRF